MPLRGASSGRNRAALPARGRTAPLPPQASLARRHDPRRLRAARARREARDPGAASALPPREIPRDPGPVRKRAGSRRTGRSRPSNPGPPACFPLLRRWVRWPAEGGWERVTRGGPGPPAGRGLTREHSEDLGARPPDRRIVFPRHADAPSTTLGLVRAATARLRGRCPRVPALRGTHAVARGEPPTGRDAGHSRVPGASLPRPTGGRAPPRRRRERRSVGGGLRNRRLNPTPTSTAANPWAAGRSVRDARPRWGAVRSAIGPGGPGAGRETPRPP